MTFLKKVWVFLKTHWYIPVVLIAGLLLKSKSDNLLKVIDAQKKSYDKQKDAIENAEKEKEESKQRIEKEFEKATQKVEAEYAKMNKEVSKRKREGSTKTKG